MKPFKFENLRVWQLALEYVDLMYRLAEGLPMNEQYNLASQLIPNRSSKTMFDAPIYICVQNMAFRIVIDMIRAATSITLNIAEGSTGQSDSEQRHFLGMALRSLIETVACQRLMARRNYISNVGVLETGNQQAHELARAL